MVTTSSESAPHRRRRILATVFCAGMLYGSGAVAAIATAQPDESAQQAADETSNFAPLPTHPDPAANHGQILSQESFAIAEGNGSGSATPQAVSAKKITYTTTDSKGGELTTAGVLTVPNQPWTGKGSRPLIAVAPGTQGAGKQCDASNAFRTGVQFGFNPLDVVLPYEGIIVAPLLAQGYAVVAIDYPRNPVSGSQMYVDNIASGQALIDSAAAALSEMGAPEDTPVGFSGYSQGGGAAGWAAENVHRYAPQLNVKASYVGAPPSDLKQVMTAVDGSVIAGVLGYATNQVFDNAPELGQEIRGEELNGRGVQMLEVNDQLCIAGSAFATGLQQTKTMTTTGQSLAEITARYPQLDQALTRQKLGQDFPRHPVLLGSGVNDDIIPYGQVDEVYKAWTAHDAAVTFHVDQTVAIPGKLAINHLLPYVTDLPNIVAFFNNTLGS